MNADVFRCKNCLNMSTRPRIVFDERGWCNACVWAEEKKRMDWSVRERELIVILDRHRRNDGRFDCLVPVSGGKDGSYVSYMLKHKYGMNPLAITVTPALSLELGNRNLQNYLRHGYNHIQINPDYEAMRVLNKTGFIDKGFPYYGWLISIQAVPVQMAIRLDIPLLFYGEDGEVEYGGTTATRTNPMYDPAYMREIYLEGGYEKVLQASGLKESQLYFFRFPEDKEFENCTMHIAHWSYFESWDPYRNYLVAKEHCGLEEAEASNSGTFTNFAQNDQALYALHTYMMYLKFGFGRGTQDAGIEIRRGAMSRDQAVNLVRLYDGHYPEEFLQLYLDYYQMNQQEFDAVLSRWVNRDLFEKVNGRWRPLFEVY